MREATKSSAPSGQASAEDSVVTEQGGKRLKQQSPTKTNQPPESAPTSQGGGVTEQRSNGNLLREMSTRVKTIKASEGIAPSSRGLVRKKSRRGDDPMPMEVPPQVSIISRSPKSVSPMEQAPEKDDVSRRLELLEIKSRSLRNMEMTHSEAARLDLVELITKKEWKHVISRLDQSPNEARAKQVMILHGTDGRESAETDAMPLHIVMRLKPPVSYRIAQLDGCYLQCFELSATHTVHYFISFTVHL